MTRGFQADSVTRYWTEHLWSACLDGAQLILIGALAWIVRARRWRTSGRLASGLLLLALAAIVVGIIHELIGNFQVARSIWQTPGDPGFGNGYVEGHQRAETGDLLVLAGGIAFAVTIGVTRRVPLVVAGLALVLAVIPPPWAWPATGVLMLLLYGLTVDGEDRLIDGQPMPERSRSTSESR